MTMYIVHIHTFLYYVHMPLVVRALDIMHLPYIGVNIHTCIENTSYVIWSELWEQNFKSLLCLVKEFVVNVWEVTKQILYGDDSCPNQLQSQSSPWGLGGAAGVEGQRDGKFREGKL